MSTSLRRAAALGVRAALRTTPAAAPAWQPAAAVAPLAARAQTLGGARPRPSLPRGVIAARCASPPPIADP